MASDAVDLDGCVVCSPWSAPRRGVSAAIGLVLHDVEVPGGRQGCQRGRKMRP